MATQLPNASNQRILATSLGRVLPHFNWESFRPISRYCKTISTRRRLINCLVKQPLKSCRHQMGSCPATSPSRRTERAVTRSQILVIEDDPIHWDLITRVITRHGPEYGVPIPSTGSIGNSSG